MGVLTDVEKRRLYFRNNYNKNIIRRRQVRNRRRLQIRLKCINFLGNKCAHCKLSDIKYLCVDHINNDGGFRRNTLREFPYSAFLKIMNDMEFSKQFQILCYNCNFIKQLKLYTHTDENRKKNRFDRFTKILSLYGQVCNYCGITTREYLTIDHINGDGKECRKTTHTKYGLMGKILRGHLPRSNFQILCQNCNSFKGQRNHEQYLQKLKEYGNGLAVQHPDTIEN